MSRTRPRSKRRLRLRTAAGTRKVTLPQAPKERKGAQESAEALAVLTESLQSRWKKFTQRVEAGLPARNRPRINDAVHDMRTAARRLLAVLAALKPIVDNRSSRRLARQVEGVLDRLGG